MSTRKGKVYLVGAGPGDPGLLTVKGRDCIRRADVLVYDYLANESFLEFADTHAECIYVGKKGGHHTLAQEGINSLILEKAQQGLTVVRLKGGDPFVFGRGGEEALELAKAGIAFEIVPGVTSPVAVPAYAGIPLTHRHHTATVAFITGHEDPTKERSNIDWSKISTGVGTLVFLMGIGQLKQIAERLVSHGRPPNTPVAVIRQGTLPSQMTVIGTLQEIAFKAENEGIKPPGIIVVGDVVNLRKDLDWFEKKPLFNRSIIVTRAREQSSGFRGLLSDLGAHCIEFPTIEIVPPQSWDGLDQAIEAIEGFDWVIFTSVNGVKYFFNRLEGSGKDIRALKDIKIGAIGPKTAEAIRVRGLRPDLVPREYRAEALVNAFREGNIYPSRVLMPRAARARDILPRELGKMGCYVEVVEAYRTVIPDYNKEHVKEMLKAGQVDMVTFTSSSTVIHFFEMFQEEQEQLRAWMKRITVACIGPITAKTAEDKGLKVHISPSEYTVPALVDTIVQYFSPSKD